MILFGTLTWILVKKSKTIKDLLYWGYSDHLIQDRVWSFLLFPLLIALGEEFMFRGYLQPMLGLILTSAVASLYHIRIHKNVFFLIPIAFIFNVVFGYSYLITGSLVIPIIMHFEFHLFNIILIKRFFSSK